MSDMENTSVETSSVESAPQVDSSQVESNDSSISQAEASYLDSVFSEDMEGESVEDAGIDSWDEAESYSVEEAPEEGEESLEADSEEAQSEEDSVEKPKDESQEEDLEADSEQSEESGEEKPLEELLESGEYELEVKVDGEVEKVSLQELKNNYSGKVAYDKKFTELDQERKGFKEEVDQVNTYINDFASKMKEGDVLGAFEYFGQFAQVPPYMIKEQLLHSLAPEYQRRMEMSAEQIQGEYVQKQNDYLKERLESESKIKEQSQAQQERLNFENRLRETHSIDVDIWEDAKSFLEQESIKEGFEVTPELVKDFIEEENRLASEYQAQEQASLYLKDFDVNQDQEALNTLTKIINDNPEFTEDDIREILTEAYGSPKQKQIEEGLQKRVSKHKNVKQTASPKAKGKMQEGIFDEDGEEVTDWSDLL